MFSLISIPRSLILLIANKTKTRPIDRALKQVGDVEDGPLKGHCNGISLYNMMTSSNGNIFRVTGALLRESTGHRWIPLTKARDAEPWCFHWSVQTVEQTIDTPVIWDAIALIMTSLQWNQMYCQGFYWILSYDVAVMTNRHCLKYRLWYKGHRFVARMNKYIQSKL